METRTSGTSLVRLSRQAPVCALVGAIAMVAAACDPQTDDALDPGLEEIDAELNGSEIEAELTEWTLAAAPADDPVAGIGEAEVPFALPTDGWTRRDFRFGIHKPYDIPVGQRYRFDAATNTHTMIVFNDDKPFKQGSGTDPRTEMRWQEEYTSGEHMFDSDVFIVPGADGSSIMQILRRLRPNGGPATAIMLVANSDGTVRRYFSKNGSVIKTNAYNNWWNLKVAHNADNGQIRVFVNNSLVGTFQDRGKATHHFKNGAYGVSARSEVRFRNMRYWRR